MSLESAVQRKAIRELESWGCKVYKLKPGYGVPTGTLDCVFFYKSFYGWIEFKASPTSPYRPLQRENLALYAEWSWSATVYPENCDIILADLRKIIEKL